MNRNNAPTPRAEMNTPPTTEPCPRLARRLQAIDFSLADTILYLDAYPTSKEALAYYHKLLAARAELLSRMPESCRHPVTCMDNVSSDAWNWIDGPWPWDPRAN